MAMEWGNPDALMEAAEAWRDAAVQALVAGGADRNVAEDCVGKAVMNARLCRATDWRRFRSFFNTCARNALVDHYRRVVPEDTRAMLEADERLMSTDPMDVLVDALVVRAEVDALPERQRDAVYLVTDGATVQDVADAQRTTYKAAEGLLARARATVRERVGAACGGVVTLLRPRLLRRAVLALPVLMLGALVLLVLRAPAPVDSPTLAAPTGQPVAAVSRHAGQVPLPRAASSRPQRTALRPIRMPVAPRATTPPKRVPPPGKALRVRRTPDHYTMQQEALYCVQHLTVPPSTTVCPKHG
jgi:DNA-directed RNA polymerase specialized sigma24 family protein